MEQENALVLKTDLKVGDIAVDGEGIERKIALVVKDSNLGVSFPVFESLNAWWVEAEGLKLYQLISGLKTYYYVKDALFLAGISMNQWKYFLRIHPGFSPLIEVFQNAMKYQAAENIKLAMTAVQMEKKTIVGQEGEPNRQVYAPALDEAGNPIPDLATRMPITRWYAERTDKGRFGREALPEGTTTIETFTSQAFRDEKGELIVSKQTAELMKSYGDSQDS